MLVAVCGVSTSAAPLPDPAHGGGPCSSDWDCSLGGVCTAQKCVCDAWFTGAACDLLHLQPAPSTNLGLQVPTYHSWGGRAAAVHDAAANKTRYEGYFSFMCNHGNLGVWTRTSASIHAVSDSPEGPYQPQKVVIFPWSHNTFLIQNPPDGLWLLWHLGNGTVPSSEWAPCFNGTDLDISANVNLDTDKNVDMPPASASPVTSPGQEQAFVQTAPSISGPWTPAFNNTGITVDWAAAGNSSWIKPLQIGGNPTPFIFPNGTTLLYFSGEPCPANWGAMAPACVALARADRWNGTYTLLSVDTPITAPESEDPFVFQVWLPHPLSMIQNRSPLYPRTAAPPCTPLFFSSPTVPSCNLPLPPVCRIPAATSTC